jgi:stress-induced-phosphoprotein 1
MEMLEEFAAQQQQAAAAISPEERMRQMEEMERARREREERAEAEAAAAKKRKEEEEEAARLAAETPEQREAREAREAAQAKKAEGNAAYKAKDFDAAIALYREAQQLDKSDMIYRVNVAAARFEKGDLEGCITECKEAIEYARTVRAPLSSVAKAMARIGNALLKQGDTKGALKAYEDSLMESHSDAVMKKKKALIARIKKEEEEAYLDAEKAVEAKNEGNEHFKAGAFPKAVEAYSEAIKRDPTQAVYWANRAAARTKLMDVQSALSDCEKALSLDPSYVKAYSRKGALQFLSKEYHKAMETYNKGLELDPENAELREGLQRTVMKINAANATGEVDKDRAARAMADPEIQAILADPMVNQALRDMQSNPAEAARIMKDPSIAGKVEKLVAAGVLQIR